jgi:hypothetical protein
VLARATYVDPRSRHPSSDRTLRKIGNNKINRSAVRELATKRQAGPGDTVAADGCAGRSQIKGFVTNITVKDV